LKSAAVVATITQLEPEGVLKAAIAAAGVKASYDESTKPRPLSLGLDGTCIALPAFFAPVQTTCCQRGTFINSSK
jgi:hypothetical protein